MKKIFFGVEINWDLANIFIERCTKNGWRFTKKGRYLSNKKLGKRINLFHDTFELGYYNRYAMLNFRFVPIKTYYYEQMDSEDKFNEVIT